MVHVSKIYRHGASLGILLHRELRNEFRINQGDVVGIRVAGEKLIVERIALEKVAVLRTGEPEVRAE